MCGIVGFVNSSGNYSVQQLDGIINEMSNAMHNRGPDDQGSWVDPGEGLALGHKRLSIIDLSAEGHQPMVSHCGRFYLTYNGEIYNYRELGKQLEGLKTTGDVEVIFKLLLSKGSEILNTKNHNFNYNRGA